MIDSYYYTMKGNVLRHDDEGESALEEPQPISRCWSFNFIIIIDQWNENASYKFQSGHNLKTLRMLSEQNWGIFVINHHIWLEKLIYIYHNIEQSLLNHMLYFKYFIKSTDYTQRNNPTASFIPTFKILNHILFVFRQFLFGKLISAFNCLK